MVNRFDYLQILYVSVDRARNFINIRKRSVAFYMYMQNVNVFEKYFCYIRNFIICNFIIRNFMYKVTLKYYNKFKKKTF